MEDMKNMRRSQIPAFGSWDYCDEMPITQYFDSAMQAGLIKSHFFSQDSDLFKVSVVSSPLKPTHRKSTGFSLKVKERRREETENTKRKQLKAPKAVDEDLYKIPPELLYQKPKRKRVLTNLWSGCLGFSCVA